MQQRTELSVGNCFDSWSEKHGLCSVFPNGSGKIKGERQPLIGDQLLTCGDLSTVTIRRPIDRCVRFFRAHGKVSRTVQVHIC